MPVVSKAKISQQPQWAAEHGQGYGPEGPNPVVKQLQQRLNELGHHLVTDGRYGSLTNAAVQHFQRKHGLQSARGVDRATLEMLQTPPGEIIHHVRAARRAADNAARATGAAMAYAEDALARKIRPATTMQESTLRFGYGGQPSRSIPDGREQTPVCDQPLWTRSGQRSEPSTTIPDGRAGQLIVALTEALARRKTATSTDEFVRARAQERVLRRELEELGIFKEALHPRGRGGKWIQKLSEFGADHEAAKYFDLGQSHEVAHIDSLVSRQDSAEHVAKAAQFMDKAARGEMAKRAPLKVREVGGKMHVLDGNSTMQVLKDRGVTHVPVQRVELADLDSRTLSKWTQDDRATPEEKQMAQNILNARGLPAGRILPKGAGTKGLSPETGNYRVPTGPARDPKVVQAEAIKAIEPFRKARRARQRERERVGPGGQRRLFDRNTNEPLARASDSDIMHAAAGTLEAGGTDYQRKLAKRLRDAAGGTPEQQLAAERRAQEELQNAPTPKIRRVVDKEPPGGDRGWSRDSPSEPPSPNDLPGGGMGTDWMSDRERQEVRGGPTRRITIPSPGPGHETVSADEWAKARQAARNDTMANRETEADKAAQRAVQQYTSASTPLDKLITKNPTVGSEFSRHSSKRVRRAAPLPPTEQHEHDSGGGMTEEEAAEYDRKQRELKRGFDRLYSA